MPLSISKEQKAYNRYQAMLNDPKMSDEAKAFILALMNCRCKNVVRM